MALLAISPREYHCAICGDAFDTKSELSNHTANHYRNPTNSRFICNECQMSFDDSIALTIHISRAGHSREIFSQHITHYFDPDKPKGDGSSTMLSYDDPLYISGAPVKADDDELQCKDCKKHFKSKALYNNHFLACTPIASPSQTEPVAAASAERLQVAPLKTKLPSTSVSRKQTENSNPKVKASKPTQPQKVKPKKDAARQPQQPHTAPALSVPSAAAKTHICNTQGCTRAFRSEPGLKQHRKDVHGIGGPKLDLDGRDSWMLGSRRGNKPSAPAPRLSAHQPSTSPRTNATAAPNSMSTARPAAVQISTNISSIADIEQSKQIHCRALRLLIQSDIFIRPDGIEIGGILWKRIPIANQDEVLRKLDTLCHLPKLLQSEYLPAPTTFKDEYQVCYNLHDFTPFPARDLAKPGLGAIVIACCKVALSTGHHEVVKIAAVNFTTGDILMNHLVCTDPHSSVADWRTYLTGFSSWKDMGAARQVGYKVFKGWSATRAALQKYVDRETIIVGYNLRADLDALRIIHGRAVDIVKVMEKAGNGPLNKSQIALDSLCFDTTSKTPKVHPQHGRDALMDAFAVREFVLWAIKNGKDLGKLAEKRRLK